MSSKYNLKADEYLNNFDDFEYDEYSLGLEKNALEYEPLGISRSVDTLNHNGKKVILRLSLSQLIVLSCLTVGLMLMVFVFSYNAGRSTGAKEALVLHGRAMARLPISSEDVTESLLSESFSGIGLNAVNNSKVAFEKSSKKPVEQVKPEFDFSNKKELPKKQDLEVEKSETKSPALSDVTSNFKSGNYVQVATLKELSEAVSLKDKLRSKQITAGIEKKNISGRTYYTILVGPYSEKEEAKNSIGKLKSVAGLQWRPFVRSIK